MSSNIDKCIIKQVWCGDSSFENIPQHKKKNYSKMGTRNDCLKKGFGAGSNIEKRKTLNQNSLQQIPYVGQKFEEKFISHGINNIDNLLNLLKFKTSNEKKDILKIVLKNKDGVLNLKAYNSTIMFLYNKGILNLPECKNIV